METGRARLGAGVVAALIWAGAVAWVLTPNLTSVRKGLTSNQLWAWESGEVAREQARMSQTTPEWDFMGRTFLVLAIANQVKAHQLNPGIGLGYIDRIVGDTIRVYESEGQQHYLMEYAKRNRFVNPAGRSVFFDGELALMLGARRMVQERLDYRDRMRSLTFGIQEQMKQSPVRSAESYPNECWTFCNTIALTAMKVQDHLEGSRQHAELIDDWLRAAKLRLVERKSGLLVSSYTVDGKHLDGPEGSSIWSVTHFLSALDYRFAESQYRLAKLNLSGRLLGFGFSREWTDAWKGTPDVDSGPVVPWLGVSPGASGQAILGATTFGDSSYASSLMASAYLVGMPTYTQGRLKFASGNQVGDAVVLYSLSQGPLWGELR